MFDLDRSNLPGERGDSIHGNKGYLRQSFVKNVMDSTPGGVFYANFVVPDYRGGTAFIDIMAKNADVDYNIVNNYRTLN